jgi:outer membrane protein assembly factor BamA
VLSQLLAVAVLCAETASRAAPPPGGKTEFNVVPVAGGDSDVGLGGGAIGDLARLRPGAEPFIWRLELGVFATFKPGDGERGFRSPYQDYYLELAVPRLTEWLRLELRPSYTVDGTQRYYGLGNASPPPPVDLPPSASQYERRRAAVIGSLRAKVAAKLYVRAGGDYARIALDVPAGGVLDEQRRRGPDDVRAILEGPDRHGLAAGQIGLEYDSRDNEIVTRTGSFHQLLVRASPRLGPSHPFHFTEANATLRVYRAPLRWLQVAARMVGDVLVGQPPIYELTRIADTSVVGGSKGIRGVPGQRYYGKVKLFGNVETRAEVWRFHWFGKPFALAAAGFVDAGRVWAELRPHPELDGRGLGLKYGLGGGLRLQEGQTFVVRADVAWSPDAEPIGAYFSAGETF